MLFTMPKSERPHRGLPTPTRGRRAAMHALGTAGIALTFLVLCIPGTPLQAEQTTSENHDGLRRLLQRYPEADLDGDRILTLEEARRFRSRLWQEETDVGKPMEGRTPEIVPQRMGNPNFDKAPYGALPGQHFDLWLPRRGAPPFPVVFSLSRDSEHDETPYFLFMSCLDAGIAVGRIHEQENSDGDSAFADTAEALRYLYARGVAYGLNPEKMALYGEGISAERALYGAFLNLSEDANDGIRYTAILDATPRLEKGTAAASEEYLERNYPMVGQALDDRPDPPVIALFFKAGDPDHPLPHALRAKGVEPMAHHGAPGEETAHLQRAAALFFAEHLIDREQPAEAPGAPVIPDAAGAPDQ